MSADSNLNAMGRGSVVGGVFTFNDIIYKTYHYYIPMARVI